jgi:septum site-determining protein MinD
VPNSFQGAAAVGIGLKCICAITAAESQDVLRPSNVGSPVTLNNAASAPARAYFDAARRLMGETVDMIVPAERRGLMNRLLGRRAA